MQIPAALPQFKERPALLIVTSTTQADFYLATAGLIESIASWHVEPPRYSDHENFSHGGGQIFESGAMIEKKKELVHAEFEKQFISTLKKLAAEQVFKEVLLCAPQHLLAGITELAKGQIKQPVQGIAGNLVKQSLTQILEHLQKR